jgi:membrane fusion protein, multidrug efflux system
MIRVLSVFLLTALVLTACGSKDKRAQLESLKAKYAELGEQIKSLETEIAGSDTSTKVVKIKDVVVTEMIPALYRHFIDVQGMVDASESVNVMPLMTGRVMRILVKEGDAVKEGQMLAELDYDLYTKQLNSLQPQLTLAKDLYERQQRLWDQKIGSELQVLQAKTQKESLEKQMETIRETIDMNIIKSPISGTVDLVSLKVGQLAGPMAMEPAFRVVNLAGLKVKGEIAEAYAAKVSKGNAVMVHFPDLNANVDAKITFVERVIDPMTRTFTAEAALTGDNSTYHPNMVAILKVIDYEKADAITLPINTIQTVGSEQFVYVASLEGGQNIARKRIVTVGTSYDGQAEITSGLAPNDKVVTAGQLDLVDGMAIRF